MKTTQKKLLVIFTGLLIILMAPPSLLLAARSSESPASLQKKPVVQKIQKKAVQPTTVNQAIIVKLPDLIVSDIRLIKGCKIQITIKNIGLGGVPTSGYNLHKGAVIQMYNGGKAWGGMRLGAVDKSRALKRPRNSVKFVWFPQAANLALGAGTHSIKVVLDNNNAVTEHNEKNNSKTSRLKCKREASKRESTKSSRSASGGVRIPSDPIPADLSSAQQVLPLQNSKVTNKAASRVPRLPGPDRGSLTTVNEDITGPIIAVVNKTLDAYNPKLNHEVTASFTVKNIGPDAMSGPLPFTMKIYSSDANGIQTLGGSTMYRWHFDQLQPGEEQTLSLSNPILHLGLYAASLVISRNGSSVPGGYSGEIVYPNEPNYQFFQVLQDYDLGFYGNALTMLDENRFEEVNGGIRIRIKNYGPDIPQEQYNRLGLFIRTDNHTIHKKPTTIVDPNGRLKNSGQNISFVWPLTYDRYKKLELRIYISILDVDDYGSLAVNCDTNPGNNDTTGSVGGYNDLVVCFIKYIYHKNPHRFRYYEVKVKNIGDLPSDSSNLKFYIEKKGVKHYGIPPLSPGKEHSITRKVYWAKKGIRKFKLEVNSSGNNRYRAVREKSLNNVLKGKIYIKKNPPGPKTFQCSDHPDAANLW
ncbi:MAG: hypothetical protein K8R67_03610 [Desulfobacteraceae bacterium]|nr:hypothetical protein [Desulfobacteraceae bacterium]